MKIGDIVRADFGFGWSVGRIAFRYTDSDCHTVGYAIKLPGGAEVGPVTEDQLEPLSEDEALMYVLGGQHG